MTTPREPDSDSSSNRATQTTPLQRGRVTSLSTPTRATVTPARKASSPARDFESPPVESRKRGQTGSMDFSERVSSRPRITDSPELTSSNVTPTRATSNSLAQSNSAKGFVNSTGMPNRLSTKTATPSNAGSRSNANFSIVSPSRFLGKAPRTGLASDAVLSSMKHRQQSSPGRAVTFNDLNTTTGEPGADRPRYMGTARRPENKEYIGSPKTIKNLGDTISKLDLSRGKNKTATCKPDIDSGIMGYSKSSGMKQGGREGHDTPRDLSTRIIKSLNSQSTGASGSDVPLAHETSKVRKKGNTPETMPGSPFNDNKSADAAYSKGSPLQMGKPSDNGRMANAGDSLKSVEEGLANDSTKSQDPFVQPVPSASNSKMGPVIGSGSGTPRLSHSTDGKSSSVPQETRSMVLGSQFGPAPPSLPGNSNRTASNPSVHPGLHFRKRPRGDNRYEKKKPVDSTAHLYTGNPEPEKYSEEWQARQLGLGLSSDAAAGQGGQSSRAASKTNTTASSGLKNGQSSSSVGKTSALPPKGSVSTSQAVLSQKTRQIVNNEGSTSETTNPDILRHGDRVVSKPVATAKCNVHTSSSTLLSSEDTSSIARASGGFYAGNRGVSGPAGYNSSGTIDRNLTGLTGSANSYFPGTTLQKSGELRSMVNKPAFAPPRSSAEVSNLGGMANNNISNNLIPTGPHNVSQPSGTGIIPGSNIPSKAPPTGPRSPSSSGYSPAMTNSGTPAKATPTGPRNSFGSNYPSGTPTKVISGWEDRGPPISGGRDSRPGPPYGGGDTYRPYHADSDDLRRGRPDEGPSDHRSPQRRTSHFNDFRVRSGYDDRYYDSRYRH